MCRPAPDASRRPLRDGDLLPDRLKDAEPQGRIALSVAEQILAAPDDFIHADRKGADVHGIQPEAPNGVDAAFGEAVEASGAAARLGRVDVRRRAFREGCSEKAHPPLIGVWVEVGALPPQTPRPFLALRQCLLASVQPIGGPGAIFVGELIFGEDLLGSVPHHERDPLTDHFGL